MNVTTKTKLIKILIPTSITFIIILLIPKPTFETSTKSHHIHTQNHLQLAESHCDGTLYPDLCISTISSIPHFHKKSLTEILQDIIRVTEAEVRASEHNVSDIESGNRHSLTRLQHYAVKDCLELLGDTIDELETVLDDLAGQCGPTRNFTDIGTYLSAAMTNQYTCLEGFAGGSSRTLRKFIQNGLFHISQHVSNSLAILKKISGTNHCKNKNHGSLSNNDDDLEDVNGLDRVGFPGWMKRKDRRLLQSAPPSAAGNGSSIPVDLVVAKDGSGNFSSIEEAVSAAPNRSRTRFVIYIKSGVYFENVEVERLKSNIMFLGDGIGKTIIKANRNVVDGYTTFRSATLAVVGPGFIAKGITVENTAGPTKHQAVALRSNSDLSAFYQCSFLGYQDTLYPHSLRQFYRECDIYGTIDFVFGNAAVVLQNCNLYAREPLPRQKNIYTAQGREDPNQNTGISILNCKVTAAADLAANKTAYKTYLGRPWKEYSRTVFMLSNIDDVVDPAGWLEWDGDFALNTLFYGEYMNRGPGSNTSARVSWPGYRVITNASDASKFTVENLISGGEWLPSYGIPYYPNLTEN
ncbi:pectinesterase-like [Amaranthus tricolor]|uniref:pectinesterase-like n=1 Tax=Amaranthus tricolor TaxID=29722 RepID=UPI0025837F6C|nr:pectinesterase-like [Amaranthus tricolor]